MTREDIQKEIARLDEEINSVVASTELPRLTYRPFPSGTWMIAIISFAWWRFGSEIPGAYVFYLETARWAFYLGALATVAALISTVLWLFSGRSYGDQSSAYTNASHKARELQERRRDLQAELRALLKD